MKGVALRSRKVILDGITRCINCCSIDGNALLNMDEFGKCENLIDQILFLHQQELKMCRSLHWVSNCRTGYV